MVYRGLFERPTAWVLNRDLRASLLDCEASVPSTRRTIKAREVLLGDHVTGWWGTSGFGLFFVFGYLFFSHNRMLESSLVAQITMKAPVVYCWDLSLEPL